MDLGVLEGQTKGGYFSDSIFDPSVNQCSVQCTLSHSLKSFLEMELLMLSINPSRHVRARHTLTRTADQRRAAISRATPILTHFYTDTLLH